MNAPKSKISSLATVVVLLLSTSALGRTPPGPTPTAAPATPPPDICIVDVTCKEFYEIAHRQSEAGQLDAALINYQNAYARKPAPFLLISIGRIYHKLRRFQQAIDSYQQFLNLPNPETEAALRTRAETFMQEAQQQMERAAEPPPEPSIANANPSAVVPPSPPTPPPSPAVSHAPQPSRPLWRLALGGAATGAGLLVMGFGISALAVNGQIIDMNSVTPGRTYDTAGIGGGLLGAGAVVVAGGVLCIALPERRSH